MATLGLRGVVKRYGDTKVIHEIDLDIADGEFVVLVGPSGCGKSTLLRMIAGLETISGGDLVIAGIRIAAVMHGRRRVTPGDVVPLAPLTAHTHLFDAASGRRL